MAVGMTPLDAALTVAPLVSRYSQEIETERQLPEPVVRALIEAGFFKLL